MLTCPINIAFFVGDDQPIETGLREVDFLDLFDLRVLICRRVSTLAFLTVFTPFQLLPTGPPLHPLLSLDRHLRLLWLLGLLVGIALLFGRLEKISLLSRLVYLGVLSEV